MVASMSFIVCILYLRQLSILSLFLWSIQSLSLLHVDALLFVEKIIFVPLYCSTFLHCIRSLVKVVYIYIDLFLVSLFWSTHLFFFFSHYHSYLITIAIQQVLKLDSVSCLTLFFSFNIVLANIGLLLLHINFRISLSVHNIT